MEKRSVPTGCDLVAAIIDHNVRPEETGTVRKLTTQMGKTIIGTLVSGDTKPDITVGGTDVLPEDEVRIKVLDLLVTGNSFVTENRLDSDTICTIRWTFEGVGE